MRNKANLPGRMASPAPDQVEGRRAALLATTGTVGWRGGIIVQNKANFWGLGLNQAEENQKDAGHAGGESCLAAKRPEKPCPILSHGLQSGG